MINYYRRDIQKKEIKKHNNYSKNCWIDAVSPNEEEIEYLVNEFKLSKELIIDGLDLNEIPRIEEEKGIVYIYVRIPTFKIENEYTGSFLIVASKSFFITIGDKKLEIFERLFRTKKDFFNNHPLKSLLDALLILSNKFSYWIRNISKEVKKNRRNLRFLKEKDIFELVIQEDILNDYLSSIDPLINLYEFMLRLKSLQYNEDEKEFIESIIIDLNQTLNLCNSSLKTITNMRDYYSTTLSNNRNNILRTLTFFTIFLTIPMVLSGIYGMNVSLPLQGHKNIFWIIVLITLSLWTVLFTIFRKLKLI